MDREYWLDQQPDMSRRDVLAVVRDLQREIARLRREVEEGWGCECRTDDPPERYR